MRADSKNRGLTLIELIVVMVIAVVVTTLGIIGITSRYNTSRLESIAKELASAMSQARTSALYKNCPTRIIFCSDVVCSDRDATASGSVLHVAGAPARFVAILRMAFYEDPEDTERPCFFPNTADPSPGLMYGWDFDRRPILIPGNVFVTPIYTELGQLNEEAWIDGSVQDANTGKTSSVAVNSLWFPNSTTSLPVLAHLESSVPVNTPVENREMADGSFALMQVRLDSCDPAADEDCLGFIIALGPGGQTSLIRCVVSAGGRTDGTNECF